MKIDRLTTNDLHIIGIAVGVLLDHPDYDVAVLLSDMEMARLGEAFSRLDNILVSIAGPNWEDKERAE